MMWIFAFFARMADGNAAGVQAFGLRESIAKKRKKSAGEGILSLRVPWTGVFGVRDGHPAE